MQVENRFTVRAAKDFDILPLNIANASPKSFGNRFFRGPTRREGIDPVAHFSDFSIRKHPVEKAVAVFFQRFLQTCNFNEVNASTEIHASILSTFSTLAE